MYTTFTIHRLVQTFASISSKEGKYYAINFEYFLSIALLNLRFYAPTKRGLSEINTTLLIHCRQFFLNLHNDTGNEMRNVYMIIKIIQFNKPLTGKVFFKELASLPKVFLVYLL